MDDEISWAVREFDTRSEGNPLRWGAIPFYVDGTYVEFRTDGFCHEPDLKTAI